MHTAIKGTCTLAALLAVSWWVAAEPRRRHYLASVFRQTPHLLARYRV